MFSDADNFTIEGLKLVPQNKEHKDYLYGLGSKVVVCYNGGIMESYPARINTNTVSLLGE